MPRYRVTYIVHERTLEAVHVEAASPEAATAATIDNPEWQRSGECLEVIEAGIEPESVQAEAVDD